MNFGEDAVQMELRFFVDFGQGLSTRDQVQMGVDRAFKENGVSFALPQISISRLRKRGKSAGPADGTPPPPAGSAPAS